MTTQLNTTIDAPITDLRDFSSLIRSKNFQHWWTLVQSKSYDDPTTGFAKLIPRVGAVGLPAVDGNTAWVQDGVLPDGSPLMVGDFATPGGNGDYTVTIPNPGNLFTVIEIARPQASGDMATWGMDFAANALNINSCIRGGGPEPVGTKLSINGRSNIAGSVVAPAVGVRAAMATVFDMTNSNIHRSVGGGAFATLSESASTTIADIVPQPDATATFHVGFPGTVDPFTGQIYDMAIYPDDLRNDLDLWDAIVAYSNSAYGA